MSRRQLSSLLLMLMMVVPFSYPAPGAAATPPPAIQLPAAGASTTLPLHILARVGVPGEQVTARLRWQNGTTLWQTFRTLCGPDGRGVLIGSLDPRAILPVFVHPQTQPATLELQGRAGVVVARQKITILAPGDRAAQQITVYWVKGERLVPTTQWVPRTSRPATAALEDLLWGPHEGSGAVTTALPLPPQVLTYAGHTASWGPRVTLRRLTIVGGVATADFSPELKAYGGGSTRVLLIRRQITSTLHQFASVRTVRITIAGQTEGVLEP